MSRPLTKANSLPSASSRRIPICQWKSVFTRPGVAHPPGVYLQQVGRGAWFISPAISIVHFWQVLNVDHGKLFHNAVEWATNEAPFVKVEGKGILDIAVWEHRIQ